MHRTIDLHRRELIGAGGAALLAAAPAWAEATPPMSAPILIAANRLWVTATINGSKPYFFCVDTGTTISFLRPEIAQALNLPGIGSGNVGGVGTGRDFSGQVEARDVIVGQRFRLPPTRFQIYDFADQIPRQAAGLLAATMFTGRDCELDFDRNEWRLWPDGRQDFAGLVRLPSQLIGPHPYEQPDRIEVTAKVDGRPYHLQVDTGAPPGVLLFAPAARRTGLFDDTHAFAPQATRGFGGATAKPSRVIRAGSFELGPLRIDRPLITAMDPNQPNQFLGDGLVGLQFLQLLTIATDTRRSRVWARRNTRPLPPDDYPLAGLWLEPDATGGAWVAVVGKGSPAAAAGVQAGDRIVDPPTYVEAMRRTTGPAGQSVALRVKRGDTPLAFHYALAPWL